MTTVRLSTAASVLVLLLAASTSCNSSQPTQNQSQVVSLSFSARSTNPTWDCWDTDVVAQPVYCEQVFILPGVPDRKSGLLPWALSAEVSVIPEGKTVEQVVATTVNMPGIYTSFTNVTAPDPAVYSGRVVPANPAAGVTYSNPQRVAQGSSVYAAFKKASIPPPNVFGSPTAFDFIVHKGDTIIVRARKIKVQDYVSALVDPFPGDDTLELKLSGTLTINGAVANALGTTQSTNADASGITMSYTVR
jgi:hypothetical protein